MTERLAVSLDLEITARAGRYYRNARYLICIVVLAAGLWFAYDGWIGYPAEQRAFEKLPPEKQSLVLKPKTSLDLRIQGSMATCLIPLSPLLLFFFLYRSRGAYHLAGQTLMAPGHPPVTFDQITAIDMSLWARKGIARVEYRLADGAKISRLTLDDFIYEQEATDQIVTRIEKYIAAASAGEQDKDAGGESAGAQTISDATQHQPPADS